MSIYINLCGKYDHVFVNRSELSPQKRATVDLSWRQAKLLGTGRAFPVHL